MVVLKKTSHIILFFFILLFGNIFYTEYKNIMYRYLIVSGGAALGGALRYWLSSFVYKFVPENFPYGTLTVNVIGSFILGFVMYALFEKDLISQDMRLFLTVGFCGGFTTFSTFSLETVNLIKNSEIMMASVNVLLNIALCLAVTYIAYILSQR
jgi:CrcB protein